MSNFQGKLPFDHPVCNPRCRELFFLRKPSSHRNMKIFIDNGFLPPEGEEAKEEACGLKPLAIVNKEV